LEKSLQKWRTTPSIAAVWEFVAVSARDATD